MNNDLELIDFGFTDDNPKIPETNPQIKQNLKAQKLYDTIVLFLDNLSSNPEKDTIHWPNRVETINSFKKKLEKILTEEC